MCPGSVTLCLEPLVVQVGGEVSLATVTEQLGVCQRFYVGISDEPTLADVRVFGKGLRAS